MTTDQSAAERSLTEPGRRLVDKLDLAGRLSSDISFPEAEDDIAARLAAALKAAQAENERLREALTIIADGTSYDPAGAIGVRARNIAAAALLLAADRATGAEACLHRDLAGNPSHTPSCPEAPWNRATGAEAKP